MLQITQEDREKILRGWINLQKEKIEVLQKEGFTVQEAIEMLKVSVLEDIESAIVCH